MKKLLIALLTLSCVLCFAGCKKPPESENFHKRTDCVQSDSNGEENRLKEPRIGKIAPSPRPRPIPSPSPVVPKQKVPCGGYKLL